MNVIILAGGEGRRMGGVDKAAVALNGRTLLDHLLDELGDAHHIIVVSPHDIAGVSTTTEDPPLGGPVAGIAAGATGLATTERFTAVLAVDAPHSARLLPRLQAAIGDADVAVTVARDGWIQPLCAVWQTTSLLTALRELGEVRNRPARALLKVARRVIQVPGDGHEADYDTVAELSTLGVVELPATD